MIGCTVYHLKKMFKTPHIDSHSTTDPKPEIQSAVLTGNRISCDGKNVRGITHVHVCRKDNIFRQRRLSHSEMRKGDYGTLSHTAEPDRWADRQVGSLAGRYLERWVDRCWAIGHAAGRGAGSKAVRKGQVSRQVGRDASGQQADWKAGRWAGRQARGQAGGCAVGQVGIQVGTQASLS